MATKAKPQPKPELDARRIEYLPLSGLKAARRNPKRHADSEVKASIGRFGYVEPMVLDERTGTLVAGHGRRDALTAMRAKGDAPPAGVREKGMEWLVPVLRGWESRSDVEAEAYLLASNQLTTLGGWDNAALGEVLKELAAADGLDGIGFEEGEIAALIEAGAADGQAAADRASREEGRAALSSKFLVPPFSVLDARQGYWQDRKRQWTALGIKSELGRDGALTYPHGKNSVVERAVTAAGGATSVFDPVLCELAYRWFCPKGGLVLDPFAGGSVRGVVASTLGHPYVGIELRGEQVEANREQATNICKDPVPAWEQGDSRHIQSIAKGVRADFIFSCPPYGDLEVYSDDKADLSTLPAEAFHEQYALIIKETLGLLKPNRFACFVVGDYRDKRGFYENFVGRTVAAFVAAGARLYNEAILVTSLGSLPLRVGNMFAGPRKLGKTHQNVLVFFKGDPKTIRGEFGDVSIPEEALAGATTEPDEVAERVP